MSQIQKFQRGSGCYACEGCGRMTRDTGNTAVGVKSCGDCWEIAGIYNVYQDEGAEGLAEYADAVKAHCANIVAKGGKLDGDATELLELVGGAK